MKSWLTLLKSLWVNNMEIKASSKYDWETIKRFNKFHNITKIKALNISIIVLDVLCAFGFCLMCAWQLLTFELIMIYLLLLFTNLMVVFTRFVLPKLQYKQNKQLHGVINRIAFQENEMLIEQCGENTSGTGKINYQAVWRIYETKDYIYIYVNPRQAHIINKSTITDGTATDLRIFLTKAVGMSKYKVKCKP